MEWYGFKSIEEPAAAPSSGSLSGLPLAGCAAGDVPPFDKRDAQLLPAAGSCVHCLSRLLNLFRAVQLVVRGVLTYGVP